MIGLLGHLSCKVNIGVSEISHFCPIFCSRLRKVREGFLDSHPGVGSVAALARGLLPLSEVGLCLYEMGLEGCPGFFVLVPPGSLVFRVLSCIGNKSVGDADYLGLKDRLSGCGGEVRAIVEPLDEALERLLRIVRCMESFVIRCHVHRGCAGVVIVYMSDEIHRDLVAYPVYSISSVSR